MMAHIQEGELAFDFSAATYVERLDAQGKPLPRGMALVDFVVEEDTRVLLVEIKDPSQARVPERERKAFAGKMKGQTLIHEELVPKARDSYTFLHLMARDTKPFLYVVLLGLDEFPNDRALLPSFKDRLLRRLRHEAQEPWRREYVTDCVVVTLETWSKHFSHFRISRNPEPVS